MEQPRHLALLTSGGDAPGMNAAIRAVVRAAHHYGLTSTGVLDGFDGLVEGRFRGLGPRDVSNIVQRGGTMLRSARSAAFRTAEGRARAVANLRGAGIDAVVVIGGNGSQAGAQALHLESGMPVIGIASTIDNDLAGTDRTIGFDTACNTAMEAIDRLRDTASSHERLFFVEVMGRDAGFIALRTAIAGGAEYAMVPEAHQDIDDVVRVLTQGAQGKGSSIVVVAEGDEQGGAFAIAQRVKERAPQFDIRVSVLGHLQRGGSPTVADRVLAGRLGVGAVEHLCAGHRHGVLGTVNGKLTLVPFAEAIAGGKPAETELLRILPILSV
ncbi:MAG: 6-phosphofructokinase [Flavobacteriales bacterium]|nr:ATP-dependent 6-phosphofructokinase 1 [Flavobacteriales bacterium]MCC6577541.1 6-phosphofructokinase [Flavobacteriales bacterium]